MSGRQLDEYKKAFRELEIGEERLGLRVHPAAYVAVNAGLVATNLIFTPKFLWFVVPLVAWGIGLWVHYFCVSRFSARGLELREQEAERCARARARVPAHP